VTDRRPGPPPGVYPVYPFQRVLALVELVAPGCTTLASFAPVGEDLDQGRAHAAAVALLDRHAALGYGFARRGGEVWQRERPSSDVVDRLEVRTGADLSRPDWIDETPLSLTRGPLLRVHCGDGVVALTTSHIVSDRWSLWLLARDFLALYDGLGSSASPPPPRRTFGELVDEDVARLAQGGYDDIFAYWRCELRGFRGIPAVSVGRHAQKGGYESFELTLTAADVATIARSVRRLGCTEFAVTCRMVASAIAQVQGTDDIVLLAMTANRPRRSSWDVIGCFTNATPLRFRLGDGEGVAERNVATALTNGAPPYEWIAERLPPTEQDVFVPNGPSLAIYVRSDGSPDDTTVPAGAHAERDVRRGATANTWGLDLDVMVDINVQSAKVLRLTFRPDRVLPATAEAILRAVAGELSAAERATPTPTPEETVRA